jgi:Tat protein secretion system quality control protein TatD with DNase activity
MSLASETASSRAPFFIDTHCHLDAAEFDADRDAVYATAIAGGVDTLVIPAVSRDNFGSGGRHLRTLSRLPAGVGHASHAARCTPP